MPKKTTPKVNSEAIAEDAVEEIVEETEQSEEELESIVPALSNFNMILISGLGISLLVIFIMLVNGGGQSAEAALNEPSENMADLATTMGDIIDTDGIERKGEGRHFYTTIKIPPGAETLYLSGSGAARNEDGSWGDMESQTIDTFASFKDKLEAEGWSLADIVQVRAFAVADEYGLLDFDGFNRGYREFFGTEENPMKPVRSFVEIAGLVVPGWLVEIEIRAARMPDS